MPDATPAAAPGGAAAASSGQGAAYGINDAGQAVGSQRFYKPPSPSSRRIGSPWVQRSCIIVGFKVRQNSCAGEIVRQNHATGAMRARRAGDKAQIRHIDANREQAETFSGRFAPIRRTNPRNTKTRLEGGPVSRQAGEDQSSGDTDTP